MNPLRQTPLWPYRNNPPLFSATPTRMKPGRVVAPTLAQDDAADRCKPRRNIAGMFLFVLLLSSVPFAPGARAEGMIMDEKKMIMNANPDRLPQDCPKISKDVNITIRAGHKHAEKFPGKMFAFDNQSWDVPACARVNITFINDDEIRHQLMIHGLPGYLYPQGMLHLELYGKGQLEASLIVPSAKKTYLVHCELPQHMEKGMKAQLKVDGGDGDLPSIPGLTKPVHADVYPVDWSAVTIGIAVASLISGFLLVYFGFKWLIRRLMSEKTV